MLVDVNIREAKTHLSRLLEQALAGDEVIIRKAGWPLVRLTPVNPVPARRKTGTANGDFVVPAGFDAPLPGEVLDQFES